MLEYIAVEPSRSVKRMTCEPTGISSSAEMTSRANKSRNSCQLVTRAAVRMSSSQRLSCKETCTGNGLGLKTEVFSAGPEEGALFNSNRSGAQMISVPEPGKGPVIGEKAAGSLTCNDTRLKARLEAGRSHCRRSCGWSRSWVAI